MNAIRIRRFATVQLCATMGAMIYLWQISSDCPDRMIAVHDKATVDPTLFRMAARAELREPARFSHQGLRSQVLGQAYLPNSAALPLVSMEAGSQLQALAGDAIQLVPALVACDDGDVSASLVNLLRAVPAVDWAGSSALYIPGTKQVMKFTALQILPTAMDGLHLARLDEFRPFILASDSVRSLFAKSALCEFALPTDVRP